MSRGSKRKVALQVCLHCGHRLAKLVGGRVGYKNCPSCGLRLARPKAPPPAPARPKGRGREEKKGR